MGRRLIPTIDSTPECMAINRFASYLGWLLAIVFFAGLVIATRHLHRQRLLVAELREDPAGLHLFLNRSVAPDASRVLITGDSRAAHLGDLQLENQVTDNRGVAGQTTSEVLARAGRDLVLEPPTALIVVAGVNDLTVEADDEATDAAIRNVSDLLRIGHRLAIPTIVVEAWPPKRSAGLRGLLLPAAMDSNLERLNREVRTACSTHGATFVETDFLLDPDGGLADRFTRDALHLNSTGNTAVRDAIVKALRNADGGED